MTEQQFINQIHHIREQLLKKHSHGLMAQMLNTHFNVSGKMVRAKLAFHLCNDLQYSTQAIAEWICVCEIFHNATLIHDDLQDKDEYRRGQMTTWKQYGINQAINAGDFLIAIAPLALTEGSPKHVPQELFALYSQMAAHVIEGQSLEFTLLKTLKNLSQAKELRENKTPSALVEKYKECIKKKTGALFEFIAKGIALTLDLEQKALVENIFKKIGYIFQIQDDILDLYGDKKREGPGCDIKEGKVSCLVVKHLELHPQDFNLVMKILENSREKTTKEDVQLLKDKFQHEGALQKNLQNIKCEKCRLLKQVEGSTKLKQFTSRGLEEILKPIRHLF